MAPLEILICSIFLWPIAILLKNKWNPYILGLSGFGLLLSISPFSALILIFSFFEAIVLTELVKRKSRKDPQRKYLHYLILLNLLAVDFHELLTGYTLEVFAISFGVIRIFMTSKDILNDREDNAKNNYHWIFLAGFYLPALAVGPVFSGYLLKKYSYKESRYAIRFVDHRLLLQGIILSVFIASILDFWITKYVSLTSVLIPGKFILLFVTFWGQSLIAEQISKFYGIELPQNFDKPWLAHNISEFWQRWHRSMAHFVFKYIFTPINLRGGTPRFAAICSFIFMGLWHECSLAYLLWGLIHGFLLISWPKPKEFGFIGKISNGRFSPLIVFFLVSGLSYMANHSFLVKISL